MPGLTKIERLLLGNAEKLSILGAAEVAEALTWSAMAEPPRSIERVRPKLRSEISACELGLQIAQRELQLCVRDLSRKGTQQKANVWRRVQADLETKLARLRVGAVDGAPVPKPTLDVPPMPTAAREALDLMLAIDRIAGELSEEATSPQQAPVSMIGLLDAELCLRWSDVAIRASNSRDEEIWIQLKELERYRRGQLLSARVAELVACAYYRRLGFEVEDVSVQQLDGASEEWKLFDLRVGAHCIDVKNARESLNGLGHFVEHCVPRFKKDRASGADVVITGVLSKYLSDPGKYIEQEQAAIVLGEVCVEDVRRLYRWSRTRFGEMLDLKGVWNPGFLPGWIFEYPVEHYPRRLEAIRSIATLARNLVHAGAWADNLPGWLLVLCEEDCVIGSMQIAVDKRKLVEDLRSIQLHVGLSRRSLFVYAMALTLESLAAGEQPEDRLATLVELISFPTLGRDRHSILGLRDPLDFVSQIAQTLGSIGRAVLERSIVLTGFRLTHPAILKGVRADGSVLTLLAYCGGWQEHPFKARCGTVPLTIAKNEHCGSCGYLICHNCAHCSNTCPECAPRQVGKSADAAAFAPDGGNVVFESRGDDDD